MRRSALLGLVWIAACTSPRPTAAPAPRRPALAPTPVSVKPRATPTTEPPLDPARIRISTRVARNEDCGASLVPDYLRVSARAPNRLVLAWLVQNMGEPFGARVAVRRRGIRLRIEAVDDALGGLICGAQSYHMRTEIMGLPAGIYRVVGPERPFEKVGEKLVPTPRFRRTVTVTGRSADPGRPWSPRVAHRRFEP